MRTIVVATDDELSLLTAAEERIYRRFRHEGMTIDEIATELRVGKDTVRKRWNNAIKKIRAHRNLIENPQAFLHRGKDVLRASVEYGVNKVPSKSLRNIPDVSTAIHPELIRLFEPGVRVRIRSDLSPKENSDEVLETMGLHAIIDEVFEHSVPPFCLVSFRYDGEEMAAAVPFDSLEVL